MSEYLILIYEAESAYATASEQVMGEVMEAHNVFSEKFGSAIKAGHALQPTLTATSIRDDGGHRRPLRRDQGGAGRLLHRGGGRPG